MSDTNDGDRPLVVTDRLGTVPHTWTEVPGDATSTLAFGVGYRDLTPRTAGLTHLVEHLVMHRVGPVALRHNAESGTSHTSFYASGNAAARADFLERVAAAVSGLDDVGADELEVVRGAVLAEVGRDGLHVARDPLGLRYGLAGLGVQAANHARLMDWTADEVVTLSRERFHAGNAHVSSTSALPTGFQLHLPAGGRVTRVAHPADALTGRTWSALSGPGVTFAGTVPHVREESVVAFAVRVVGYALHETLRSRLGHVYSVDEFGGVVDDDGTHWAFTLDPPDTAVDSVVVHGIGVLQELATAGPRPEHLEHARATAEHDLSATSSLASWLDWAAVGSLRGRDVPTIDQELRAVRSATADDVRSVVVELLRTMLVGTSFDHEIGPEAEAALSGFGAVPRPPFPDPLGREPDEVAQALLPRGMRAAMRSGMTSYHGRRSRDASGQVVFMRPECLILAEPGMVTVVPYDEVVLAGIDADGEVELAGARGDVLWLDPADFKGLTHDQLLAHVPADVIYRKDGPATAEPRSTTARGSRRWRTSSRGSSA
ncbi:peptidase M16 family protein [Cellulomonas rhizosphaerae]|nr:insulinase family protein [Cellulomonas rhizosphaerae]